MNKKSLVAEIENLVEKNNVLFSEKKQLSQNVDELNACVLELSAKINELTAEIEQKNNEIESLKQNVSINKSVLCGFSCEAESTVEICDAPSYNDKAGEQDDSSEPVSIEYGADVELASSTIGEVVLKCTELCAYFSENGGSNAKDLINLALGRTEVFKSEALAIIESNDDTIDIVNDLQDKKQNVLDYFKLLEKQI